MWEGMCTVRVQCEDICCHGYDAFHVPFQSIGAAIVVMVQEMSPAFSLLQYNPQCFLVFEDLYSPLSDHNASFCQLCIHKELMY